MAFNPLSFLLNRTRSPRAAARRPGIGHLRWILPLVAFCLGGIIIYWPHLMVYLNPPTEVTKTTNMPTIQAQHTALRPQFNGTDRKNQPYILVADEGAEFPEQYLILQNPHLKIFLHSGEIIEIRALEGTLYKQENKIKLLGKVDVQHSTGYHFITHQAWVELDTSEATGEDPVEGQGPAGQVCAKKGFALQDSGKKMIFFGQAELDLILSFLPLRSQIYPGILPLYL